MIGRTIAPSRRDAIRALAALSIGLPTMAYSAPSPAHHIDGNSQWAELAMAYHAARAAEYAYDEGMIEPFFDGIDPNDRTAWSNAAIPITGEMWATLERLSDERLDAEKALMDCPSPDTAGFALKYLIAHGDGRESDCWDPMLEAEAKRFSWRAQP